MQTAKQAVCRTLLAALSVTLVTSQTVSVHDSNDVIAIIGEEGHDYEKFCQVDSGIDDVQSMQWLRNDDVVLTLQPDNNGVGHIFISNMDMTASQAGLYCCRVQRNDNSLTDPVRAGRLTVLDADAIVAPSPQYALFGASITLQCSIEGIDAFDTWAISGSQAFTSGGNVIPAVMWSDEGSYTCRLSQQLMVTAVLRDVQLRITVPPVVTAGPAELYTFTGDNFDHTISLQFAGRSGDTSTITWRKDGVPLNSIGTGYSISTEYRGNTEGNTSLVFTEGFLSRSFRGAYNVSVINNNDAIPERERSAIVTFQISVTVPPASITRVHVSSVSLQLACIDWEVDYRHSDEEPDYIIITIHVVTDIKTVQYRLEDREEWERQTYEVGVVPGTHYQITLQSVNEDGYNVTQPASFESQPSAPLVESVNVSRLNRTAFRITADLLYTGGGQITRFLVSFRVSDESEWNGDAIIPTELVPDSDNLRWTGVIQRSMEFAVYSRFHFQVQVQNERELTSSPTTQPDMQVLPGPPVRIDAVSATKTTAVLEVELSSVGTPPLMVFVDLTSHPELVCCPNQTTYQSGDTVRFSLEGLSERTTYTVNVFARNLAGQGSGEQHSFMTEGDSSLQLWQIVLIWVCGALVLGVMTVLFCVFLCCCCKASKKWGRKEYRTGPIEMASKELDRCDPILTRSVRSNGYASSQVSYVSQHGVPLTPRTPTGLASPSFDYTDAPRPIYDDVLTRPRLSSSTSPFHSSAKAHLFNTSASQGDLYSPPYSTHRVYPDEVFQSRSLPRGGFMGTQESVFSYSSTISPTLSPPPAPKSCATDV